jgi:predicted transcriptional regulator
MDGEAAYPLTKPDSQYDGGEAASAELHNDLKERLDLLAWLNTVILLLLAEMSSRLLEAFTREKVEPMRLVEQALRRSVEEQDEARRKLAAGWRAFKRVGRQDGKMQP